MFKLSRNITLTLSVCFAFHCHGMDPAAIIATGSEAAIIELLEKGFDTTRVVEHDRATGTVFHFAAKRGFVKVFDWGKERNAKYARAGHPQLDLNAPLTTGVYTGTTPLDIAAENGQVPIFEWICSNCPKIDLTTATLIPDQMVVIGNRLIEHSLESTTPLHHASAHGQTSIIAFCKSFIPTMNLNPAKPCGEEKGITCLHTAAVHNKPQIFVCLDENCKGMDLNPAITEGNREGQTPLHLAAQYGHVSIFDVLFVRRPGMNFYPAAITGPHAGKTPLIDATLNEQFCIIEWYATHGFNIDEQQQCGEKKGRTPLGVAAEQALVECARYLVFLGASLEGPLPPAQLARNLHNNSTVNYLEQFAPRTQQLLKCCSKIQWRIAQEEKLQARYNELIRQKDHNPKELMNVQIVSYKNQSTIKTLISRVKQLVTAGAEIDLPEETLHATTPLHCLVHVPSRNNLLFNCFRWLVEEHDANVNALDLQDNTPLSLACAKGNRLLALYLLNHGAQPTIGKNSLQVALEKNTHEKLFPIFRKILCGTQSAR